MRIDALLRNKTQASLVVGRESLYWRVGHAPGAAAPTPLADHTLETMLSALALCVAQASATRIRLVLGASWCHFLLIPWAEHLSTDERWRNVARARLDERLGSDATPYDLELGQDLPGCARVAVAWPAEITRQLRAMPAVASLRVDLLESVDALLQRRPAFRGAMLEVDAGAAGFALIADGRICRLRSTRFDTPLALASALRAELALQHAAEAGGAVQEAADDLVWAGASGARAAPAAIATLIAAAGFPRVQALATLLDGATR